MVLMRGKAEVKQFNNPRQRQKGSVLVEFALVALVLYLLLAATIEIGRLLLGAQIVQDVARVAARDLALTPFPADPAFTFDDALEDPEVLAQIYDPRFLVVDVSDAVNQAGSLDAYFARMPSVNQMLRPLMIPERLRDGGVERLLLRYPGALLRDAATGEFIVSIPRIVERQGDTEFIEWVSPVEEIRADPDDPSTGAFSVASSPGGLIAIRINYPFQAGSLSGFRESAAGPLEPNVSNVIEVGSVVSVEPLPGELLLSSTEAGTYAGPYGLGRQFALTKTVRPWRRLISGQMIMRREVYR